MSSDPIDVHAIRLAIVVGWANAFYAVVAIWVALGRGWWFARAAVLCGLLLALLTLRTENYARAYDLYVPFALRSAAIIGGLLAWRAVAGWWRRRRTNVAPARRISLRDLLLGMVLVAVLFTTAQGSYEDLAADLYRELSRSLIWAGIGLAVVLAVMLPRWWLKWIPVAAGLAAAQLWLVGSLDWYYQPKLRLCALVFVLLVDGSVHYLRDVFDLTRLGMDWVSPSRAVRWSGWVRLLLVALLVVPAPLLFTVLLQAPERPPPETTCRVALDRLVELAETLPTVAIGMVTLEEAEKAFRENRETLDEVRTLIRSEEIFSLPLTWTGDDTIADIEPHNRFRQIVFVLEAYGCARADAGDIVEATRAFEEIFLLGRKCAGQRLPLDFVVAVNLERAALNELAGIADQLSRSERARLRDLLTETTATALTADTIAARDALWNNVVLGWAIRLLRFIEDDALGSDRLLDHAERRRWSNVNLLLTMLAIEDYRQEHGRLPDALHELPCEPEHYQDPFSDRPLIYRLSENGDDYQLYSVGYNLTDDGGDESADVSLPVSWWQVPLDVDDEMGSDEVHAGEIDAEGNRPGVNTGDSP